MSKELALSIVIGSAVGGAINGVKSVIGGVDSIGKAVSTLNKKKIAILDNINKDFKAKLAPVEKELESFYSKKRTIEIRANVIKKELKDFRSLLSKTDKEIKTLNKRKLDLNKKFKEGSISAKAFNSEIDEIENSLNSLSRKKLNLEQKFEKAQIKANSVNNSLSSVDRRISHIKRNKLKLAEELSRAKDEAIKTNRELKHIENRISKLSKYKANMQNLSNLRDRFRARLIDTVAIGATISAPVKVAIDYESAFADVRKVVNFANKEEEKAFSKEIVKLSTKIPLSAEAIASITASGGQLGIAKNKLLDFTKSVAKMKVAFDMNANEAGESIAKLMNIYALSVKGVNNLGDAINHLSDNTAAKARGIVNVLSRIGGTAKMFGLSAKEAASLSDAFLAMGKPPEVAATAINAMLNKLNTADKQGKKFQQGLDAIGFSAEGLKKAISKDANGAIMVFLEQIKKFDKQKQMGILSDLFGMEYSDDIALLISGLDNYKKALKLTSNEQNYFNSMQKEFENRSSTTEAKLKLLKNSLSSIAISMGTILLPAIKTAADGFKWVADKVENLSQKYPMLTSVIVTTTVGLGAFAVATSVGGYAVSILAGGVLKVFSAFGWLKSLLMGGLGLRATAAKTAVLSRGMCSTGACSIYASRGIATVAKTAIASIGGILALGSAFIYLNNAIAKAGSADINSKKVMAKGLAKLKEQEQYLQDRIKASKEGSLVESFLHGSNDKYKIKALEKRLQYTQKQIKKVENSKKAPTVPNIKAPTIPKIDIPTVGPINVPGVVVPTIPKGPLPVKIEDNNYKDLLKLAQSGLTGQKDKESKSTKKEKKHKKSKSLKHARGGQKHKSNKESGSSTSSNRAGGSSRGGGNNYNINITLSGTNESLVAKLESLLPTIIKDIESDKIGRAYYDM